MPSLPVHSRHATFIRAAAIGASLVVLLATVAPSALIAQAEMLTPSQRAEVRAVPLSMELSRRAYGVSMDVISLVKTDPAFRKVMFSTMGASLDDAVRMLDAQPKLVAIVRAAKFSSVRDYEISNLAFVTAYSAGNAYPGESLDPDHLTSPAQVAFVRAHQAELATMTAKMPMLVPHTKAP